MKIRSFEFNLRELAGSMGDFGTLFPYVIGYVVVCGLNPSGILIMMGLANIGTGLVYRLPMPIEPMKILAVAAIAQHWSPSMVYACGFAMGIVWLAFAFTGIIGWIAKVTPSSVIRGIQVTLGIILTIEALKMMTTWWTIGAVSVLLVLLLRKNRYAPAPVVLMVLGVFIMIVKGQFEHVGAPAMTLPPMTKFSFGEIWQTMLLAGLAQIPLTITNATIATASLIKEYWPEKRVSEKKISLSQGIMNTIPPFFGGMPMCHGTGGLAGQYYFGARTGGTNIIEGLIEISLGLFFAGSIAGLLAVFPTAIIGAMMFMVGIELVGFARHVRTTVDIVPAAGTIIVSLVSNMAFGFLAGLALYQMVRLFSRRRMR